MININGLAQKLESILNGTYSEIVLPDGRPDFYFKVKTYGTMIDSVIDRDYKKNFIPVILSTTNGDYEAIKNSGLANEDYNLSFFFPIEYKDEMQKLALWLCSVLCGNYLSFGDETTSKVATNVSKPTFNQIENQNFEALKEIAQYFKYEVKTTKTYIVMELELYTSYANEGIEFGNAVSYELEIQETQTSLPYKETLLRIDSSNSIDSAINSQQIINDYFAKGVISSTAKAQTIQFLFKRTNLCLLLLDRLERGEISNLYSVKLYKKYNFETPIEYEFDVIPTSIIKTETIGNPISFTMSFVPKAEIDGE